MYKRVPPERIIESLMNLRQLHRLEYPRTELERLASERRELVVKYLISNLRKTGEHPTLKTLREIASSFLLTIGGAHELFGYDLDAIRHYDERLNAGRTHIVESYSFNQDRLIDYPLELAPSTAFCSDAMLSDLVWKWQEPIPFQTLVKDLNRKRTTFLVHVGTKDSYGGGLPPGSMGLVELIGAEEAMRPNSRATYLLQFSYGYRVSRCIVTNGKLHLINSARRYVGPTSFAYPGSVRIAGRVRSFGHALPQPELDPGPLEVRTKEGADLVLPWEHGSRDRLLATKHLRFVRNKEEEAEIRELLNAALQTSVSDRTSRRYRRPSASEPHVAGLIELSLAHYACYSDALRAGTPRYTDEGRYSLATLLRAQDLSEAAYGHRIPTEPASLSTWIDFREEYLERTAILHFKFPDTRLSEAAIFRLQFAYADYGMATALHPGTWLLLKPLPETPDMERERRQSGWSRPLYVLHKGLEIVLGHLEWDGVHFALLRPSDRTAERVVKIGRSDLGFLRRVVGIIAPV